LRCCPADRPGGLQAPVTQFVLASTSYLPTDSRVEIAEVNGQPAAILHAGEQVVLLIALEVGQDGVRAIRVIGNSEKLRAV
jgi:hypothetical protein